MLNSVVLVGRLTRDPELRKTPNGSSVASFRLASDDSFSKNGTEKTTIYIDVTVFGARADTVAKYMRKGSMVGVTGRLSQRKYVSNKTNTEVTVTEIIANGDLPRPPRYLNHPTLTGLISSTTTSPSKEGTLRKDKQEWLLRKCVLARSSAISKRTTSSSSIIRMSKPSRNSFLPMARLPLVPSPARAPNISVNLRLRSRMLAIWVFSQSLSKLALLSQDEPDSPIQDKPDSPRRRSKKRIRPSLVGGFFLCFSSC